MDRSNVMSKLRGEISTALSNVEASTGLEVQFQPLHGTSHYIPGHIWHIPVT